MYLTSKELTEILCLIETLNQKTSEISVEVKVCDVNGDAVGKIALSDGRATYSFFPGGEVD